jgi:hypothetical protein
MPKYVPAECPKCGTVLPKRAPKGGQPTRWCCEGCQRAGEAEMARLQSTLRTFEHELFAARMSGWAAERQLMPMTSSSMRSMWTPQP